ncbi:Na+/H+ antiporter NhaC family protein [Clostridium perfringens]|uniref:Na+/H+ antiporter NhaC family protein n=1 Tax=Clostridium perfringens TaxID=1502 RepID=UPI000E0CA5F6|nr:Na+/H+ antiporter NhaC family protein [Clostridium perfringens]AXH53721.1 sodium:proton antiporter [Clostridium perfringens]MBI6028142.1 Na+/H+ antiporter NhaC family protein [Clostridium perfringens]MBI6031448.1 Na+/H+ antiporter NhaC family protein [Clostridium perfringens]
MRNKTRFKVFLTVFAMTMLCSTLVFAAEDAAAVNSAKFGMWTVLPPLVSIVLAFLTKNVVVSLFIGTITGCIMLQLNGFNIITALTQGFIDFTYRALNSLADPWNAGIILQVLVIGGVIHLVAKMGGAKAIAEALARKAKTVKSAQLTTWLLGLAVFFDDYANSLIVGPIMRPVTDKLGVSREKLAFVIDATAAPIAGLAIISTWIGLEVGLIGDALKSVGIQADGFGVFLETIPYRFYNILILAFVVISAITLREFGPMLKAERRARRGEVLSTIEISSDSEDLEPIEGIKLSVWNAIIPIGVLIVSSLIGFYYSGWVTIMGGEDLAIIELMNNTPFSFAGIQAAFSNADASVVLFQSALLATIVALILGVSRKIFTISEGIGIWIEGMKGLLITGVILILAWSLSSVIKELGTASYLVGVLSDAIPAFLLPAIIFILGSIIAFATGTAYGTMGILMPLAIPLAFAINPEWNFVIVSTSAVLTGAIFGDHCSPISDTTILSSTGAGCDHIEHVRTQIWYAVFVGIVTVLFGYIPAGLGLSIFIVLPLSLVALFILTMIFGKKVDDKVVSN